MTHGDRLPLEQRDVMVVDLWHEGWQGTRVSMIVNVDPTSSVRKILGLVTRSLLPPAAPIHGSQHGDS